MTEYPSLKNTRVKRPFILDACAHIRIQNLDQPCPQPCLLYSFGRFIRTSNPEGDGPTSRLDDAERPITRTGALWPSTLVPAASYWPEMTGVPFFFSSGALLGFLLKPLRARMKLLLLEPESYPSLQQRTLKLLPRGAVHIVDAFAPKGRWKYFGKWWKYNFFCISFVYSGSVLLEGLNMSILYIYIYICINKIQ